jgi:predicted short-subunit dehydrogenase-like oxidoreductase (DUF2520 family)
MNVAIIGSGNVATVMGTAIIAAGHRVLQVVARRPEAAAPLAAAWGCPYTEKWAGIDPAADLYLFALSDRALEQVAGAVRLPGRLVVHTAGAVPTKVLAAVSDRCGVLYPLQSLRSEIRPFPEFPLLVDTCRPADLPGLDSFARSIARQVRQADDITRLKLHVAAVLVNNFGNHLYSLAADLCRKEHLDFSLLLPVIRETAERIGRYSPQDVQTGPAIREDSATMQRHLEVLAGYNSIKDLYIFFSREIGDYYHPNAKSEGI